MVNRLTIVDYQRKRAANLAARIDNESRLARPLALPHSRTLPASPRPRPARYCRSVIDTTSGRTWSSVLDCAIDLGIAETTLHGYLRHDIPIFPRGSHRAVHLSLASGGAA